jgi:hypothetical protein
MCWGGLYPVVIEKSSLMGENFIGRLAIKSGDLALMRDIMQLLS